MRTVDITRLRSGMLLVTSRVPSEAGKRTRWNAVCDCGGTKVAYFDDLKRGYVLSCGCARNLPFILANSTEIIRWYKDNAARRGLSWEISDEQFADLIRGACYFCGYQVPTLRPDLQKFASNGVDRLENVAGYAASNTVSCCKICNHAKHTMSESDFMVWVKRIAQYQAQKQTSGSTIEQRSAAASGS